MQITRRLLLTLWVIIVGGNWVWAFQTTFPLDLSKIDYGFSVKQYTKDDGLPMNSTSEILQHPNGFIYIATFDGLVRFDGNQFQVFDNASNPELGRNRFMNIEIHFKEGLWVLDGSYRLYHFVGDKFHYLNKEIHDDIRIYDFMVSTNGQLTLYTDKGLFDWYKDGTLVQLDSTDYLVQVDLVPKQKKIDYGLYSLISKLAEKGLLNNFNGMSDVRQIIVDHQENYWVATNTQGVYKITKHSWKTIGRDTHPNLFNIYGMYLDNDHSLWLGAFQNGIFRLHNNLATHYSPLDNSTVKSTRTFYRFNKDSLLAGSSWGVSILKDGEWEETSITKYLPTGIDVNFKDSKERGWIGTNKGLFRVKNGQAYEFKDDNGSTISQTKAIVESKNDSLLYFATIGQGVAILGESEEFKFITTSDGLSSNQVRDIYESTPDTLWAVNEDRGLNRIVWDTDSKNWSISYITEKDGLSDNSLHKIIFDDYGSVWLNSNSGVMRLDAQNLNAYLDGNATKLFVEVFGKEDGLENIEGNGGAQSAGLILPNGLLVFPNQAGIIVTNPKSHYESVHKNRVSRFPPMVQRLILADTTSSLMGSNQINIPDGVHDFRIAFTAIEYTKPEDLELWYKLEGFQDQWQKVNEERVAVYSNVGGGEYYFKVRARYPGDIEFVESSMSVFVTRRYYETYWFYLLMVTIGISIVFGIVKWRTHVLLKNEKKLKQKVGEQTLSLKKSSSRKRTILFRYNT